MGLSIMSFHTLPTLGMNLIGYSQLDYLSEIFKQVDWRWNHPLRLVKNYCKEFLGIYT